MLVHSVDSPTANSEAAQVIGPGMMSSVTATLVSRVDPLLKTVKVTVIVDPWTTRAPGAALASWPLIFFTTYIPGCTACA